MFNAAILASRKKGTSPVQYRGSSSNTAETNGGNFTCALPANSAVGDFMIAVVGVGSPIDQNMNLVSSGWTKRADIFALDPNSIHGSNLAVFTKFRTAGDTNIVATGYSSTSSTIIAVSAYRNVHPTNPLDVSIVTQYNQWGAYIASQPITPATQGAMVVGGGICSSFYTSGTVSGSLAARAGAPEWTTTYGSQSRASNGMVTGQATGHVLWPGSGQVASRFFDDAYIAGNYGTCCSFSMALRPAA